MRIELFCIEMGAKLKAPKLIFSKLEQFLQRNQKNLNNCRRVQYASFEVRSSLVCICSAWFSRKNIENSFS